MYTHVWYELSGLPTYGVNLDSGEVARQSYTLKVGRRNIEERGEWKVVGKLTEVQTCDGLAKPLLYVDGKYTKLLNE